MLEDEVETGAIAVRQPVEHALEEIVEPAVMLLVVGLLRKREAIIGVSVSDTKAETKIVIAMVTENSRNRRPMMPLISSSGISTATSETEIEMMVKPISAEPLSAASNGFMPSWM